MYTCLVSECPFNISLIAKDCAAVRKQNFQPTRRRPSFRRIQSRFPLRKVVVFDVCSSSSNCDSFTSTGLESSASTAPTGTCCGQARSGQSARASSFFTRFDQPQNLSGQWEQASKRTQTTDVVYCLNKATLVAHGCVTDSFIMDRPYP